MLDTADRATSPSSASTMCSGWSTTENLPPDHPLFDCLVIDETSKLKDPKSKRAKALGRSPGASRTAGG